MKVFKKVKLIHFADATTFYIKELGFVKESKQDLKCADNWLRHLYLTFKEKKCLFMAFGTRKQEQMEQ